MLAGRAIIFRKARDFWVRYRWFILAITVIFSALFELHEYILHPDALEDTQHIFELLLQGIILPLLLVTLQRTETQKNLAVNSLALIEQYIYQLNNAQSWDELCKLIVQIPRSFIPLVGAALWLYDPVKAGYISANIHVFDESRGLSTDQIDCIPERHHCQSAVQNQSGAVLCTCLSRSESDFFPFARWCLVLNTPNGNVGLLHLYTAGAYRLSHEQLNFLHNIGSEMATCLQKASMQRKIKLREAEVEEEKRQLSKDLHDTLGQDIAFLRHKIDYLLEMGGPTQVYMDDLKQMGLVAEEANQMIRNILAGTHGQHSAALHTRLLAYAQAIGERANLKVSFRSTGPICELSEHVKFQIFLIFREILANVENHSHASNVVVALDWAEHELQITVADDGDGFLVEQAHPGHFGLSIIRARSEVLGGQMKVSSAPMKGTQVFIQLPLNQASLVEAQSR